MTLERAARLYGLAWKPRDAYCESVLLLVTSLGKEGKTAFTVEQVDILHHVPVVKTMSLLEIQLTVMDTPNCNARHRMHVATRIFWSLTQVLLDKRLPLKQRFQAFEARVMPVFVSFLGTVMWSKARFNIMNGHRQCASLQLE